MADTNTANTIPIPQSPVVDLKTGFMTIPWYRFFANPTIGSGPGGVITVSQGGTGITSGTPGGVLSFVGPNTIASSPTLRQYEIVFGGGSTGTPSTPLGTGSQYQVLHGNAGGFPTWGPVNLQTDTVGSIGVPQGGTGHGSYSVGDILYADTPSSIARLPISTTPGYVLTTVSGLPAWAPGAAVSISQGTGIACTPNPITGTGTVALAARSAVTLMGNPAASAATPTDITIGTGLTLSVGGVLSATSVSPTQTITASENITAPAMVHIHTTGGTTTVRNASAANSTRPARGFILTSVTSGNPAAVYGPGQVITGFPGGTLTGDSCYLATTSVGSPSNTGAVASGNMLQRVGTPISSTAFIFDPDDGIVMP